MSSEDMRRSSFIIHQTTAAAVAAMWLNTKADKTVGNFAADELRLPEML